MPGSGVSGVNVTTAPFTVYVPATLFPLALMSAAGEVHRQRIHRLVERHHHAALVTATPVAPFAGAIDITCAARRIGTADLAVVKLLLNACTALPARSVNPPAATVTVYAVPTASGSRA